ncbi:MAG: UDP-glucose 4-epimerase GalE [Prevotellaceae bacterium]|jgi:UDP-glucose 4-epimerase|nr:UDP-glucose 4-epimerase GalE [Prevotellaceae bacterium]
MSTILVTGGAGYIGSHTVVELLNAGYQVISIDDYSNSTPAVYDGIEKICQKKPLIKEIDCTDKLLMSKCFQSNGKIDAVIHFAASKFVGESVEQPLRYYRNNIDSLLTVLELMEEFGVGKLVFSSSCTVYGQAKSLPVTEESPIVPATSPYGNTKQICEEMIRDAIAVTPLNAISLRYFNPIGAHPSALIGELPQGVPQNILPFITQTAIGKRKQLQVFGNDYNTPDGSCIRDYIYVVDLAKAHVAALSRMMANEQKRGYEVFNLGTGRGLSVLELVRAFGEATGVPIPFEIIGRRAGDIEQIWADPSKANRELGWCADTPIHKVLQSAWSWEQRLNERCG